jgi:hypothetical protein
MERGGGLQHRGERIAGSFHLDFNGVAEANCRRSGMFLRVAFRNQVGQRLNEDSIPQLQRALAELKFVHAPLPLLSFIPTTRVACHARVGLLCRMSTWRKRHANRERSRFQRLQWAWGCWRECSTVHQAHLHAVPTPSSHTKVHSTVWSSESCEAMLTSQ